MLGNIYYEGNLLRFMNKKFYRLKNEKITNNKKRFYERVGFYLVRIKKKQFLILMMMQKKINLFF